MRPAASEGHAHLHVVILRVSVTDYIGKKLFEERHRDQTGGTTKEREETEKIRKKKRQEKTRYSKINRTDEIQAKYSWIRPISITLGTYLV